MDWRRWGVVDFSLRASAGAWSNSCARSFAPRDALSDVGSALADERFLAFLASAEADPTGEVPGEGGLVRACRSVRRARFRPSPRPAAMLCCAEGGIVAERDWKARSS